MDPPPEELASRTGESVPPSPTVEVALGDGTAVTLDLPTIQGTIQFVPLHVCTSCILHLLKYHPVTQVSKQATSQAGETDPPGESDSWSLTEEMVLGDGTPITSDLPTAQKEESASGSRGGSIEGKPKRKRRQFNPGTTITISKRTRKTTGPLPDWSKDLFAQTLLEDV